MGRGLVFGFVLTCFGAAVAGACASDSSNDTAAEPSQGQAGTGGASADASADAGQSGGAGAAGAAGTANVDGGAGLDAAADAGDAAGFYALSPDRVTAYKPGVTYNGGIPSTRPQCGSTLNAATYGNGATDASSAIQTAIDNCPAGQAVMLSAGTFTVNSYVLINKGITLRGAGAGVTSLRKTNGAQLLNDTAANAEPVLIVGPNRWPKTDDTTARDLTADGSKGSPTVTVSDAAGFAAGQFVLLDEASGADWRIDPTGRGQIWAAPDWRVVWQKHNPALGTDDFSASELPTTPGAAGEWFSRLDRPTSEVKEVAAVSGNTITFTTPLHISYRVANKAELVRFGSGDQPVKNAGIEAMTVSGGGDGAIRFEAAAYCWARNIENTLWLGEGFAIDRSFRVEVRDSYVHDGAWSEPGGGGYAFSLADGSAEILIENNISMMANKVMVARCSGAGSVFGYNYADDGFILTAEGWIEVGLNASHMVGPHHVLFEGNYGFNFDSDKTHGNSIYHTVFRNWLRGVRRPFVNPQTGHSIDDANQSNGPKRCAGAGTFSYWMSFVGNVLGASGEMSGWVYDTDGDMTKSGIWLLGWDDWDPYPVDLTVKSTAIRDGNWDWVQSKQTWHNSAAAPLPDSLYLTAKPAFFGNSPWPWVDPSTGTVHTLPAKARFDAGTPNTVP